MDSSEQKTNLKRKDVLKELPIQAALNQLWPQLSPMAHYPLPYPAYPVALHNQQMNALFAGQLLAPDLSWLSANYFASWYQSLQIMALYQEQQMRLTEELCSSISDCSQSSSSRCSSRNETITSTTSQNENKESVFTATKFNCYYKSRNSYTTKGKNQKLFVCNICSRSFGYKHVLQNHQRIHTGEKPFECKTCNKRFTRDHHLKTHIRLHTGERPYHCEHCDKNFVQVANLRRHLRVHCNDLLSCRQCPLKFSDSNQLNMHQLIHGNEKESSCDNERQYLANHKCDEFESSLMTPLDEKKMILLLPQRPTGRNQRQ